MMEHVLRRRSVGRIGRVGASLLCITWACSLHGNAQDTSTAGNATKNTNDAYVSDPGNFRIRIPGQPKLLDQSIPSPRGAITQKLSIYESPDRFLYGVIYTDMAESEVKAVEAEKRLEASVRGLLAGGQRKLKRQRPISLGVHPGREVVFEVDAPKKDGRGLGLTRIYLIGTRLYQVIMIGPESKVRLDDFQARQDSFELLREVPLIAKTSSTRSQPKTPRNDEPAKDTTKSPTPGPVMAKAASPTPRSIEAPQPKPAREAADSRKPSPTEPAKNEQLLEAGAAEGPNPDQPAEESIEAKYSLARLADLADQRDSYRDFSLNGGILTGVRVTYVQAFGKANIGSIQPIYQLGRDYSSGVQRGKPNGPVTTVMARPGYAVGGTNTKTGLNLDAFQLVFMKYKDGQLDPSDSYLSPWLGDPKGGGPKSVTSAGKLVVGIYGRAGDREVKALGLIVAE